MLKTWDTELFISLLSCHFICFEKPQMEWVLPSTEQLSVPHLNNHEDISLFYQFLKVFSVLGFSIFDNGSKYMFAPVYLFLGKSLKFSKYSGCLL